jgi:tRNA(Arg) A34 adenosine deaminase TadA
MFSEEIMKIIIEKAENLDGPDVPIVAAIADFHTLISVKSNAIEAENCSFLHAEFLAIQDALSILNVKYLSDYSLYVTLEPCAFCAAALEKVRITDIFFGAYDPKCGAICHNSRIFEYSLIKPNIIGGLFETRCSAILQSFFRNLRKK